jgi:protein TonB
MISIALDTMTALERSATVHTFKLKPAVQHIPLQLSAKETAIAPEQRAPGISWLGLVFVLMAHVGLLVVIALRQVEAPPLVPATPMMVSLIAPPALEPELAPIIEPVKPEPKPIVKPTPKKVVQEIKPIDTPVPRQIEATTVPVMEEVPSPPVALEAVAEAPKAPAKAEPKIEDKIEPPRFGVAYLNNPQPDYPSMSRRLGEEGRVLMKVLVAADGSPKMVELETSSGSERLDNAAVNAVKKWRFLPARKNNQALDAYVLVPIKFSLNS